MRLELTTDAAAGWVAKQWLGYQYPAASERDRVARLNVVKFNVLATAFNASTVMLTAAVALAVFSTASAAVVWGAIGLALRFIAEREINRFAAPVVPQRGEAPERFDRTSLVTSLFIRMFDHPSAAKDREECILEHCKVDKSVGKKWDENEAIFLDYIIWKNPLPVNLQA